MDIESELVPVLYEDDQALLVVMAKTHWPELEVLDSPASCRYTANSGRQLVKHDALLALRNVRDDATGVVVHIVPPDDRGLLYAAQRLACLPPLAKH